MKFRFLWAGAAAALLALAIGCGGSPTSATAQGNFRVMLTDSPFADAKAVLVTFSDLSIHSSGGGWTPVVTTTTTCDLKQLQNAQTLLGSATLQPGHYTQIRVTVATAALSLTTAAPPPACVSVSPTLPGSQSIDVPSGQLIINREFDIPSGSTVTLTLDFKGDQSIIQTGNGAYKMTPVIAAVSVQ